MTRIPARIATFIRTEYRWLRYVVGMARALGGR